MPETPPKPQGDDMTTIETTARQGDVLIQRIETLRNRVAELEAALRTAEPAINSSYLQAIAEINMHDKVAARHDEIVQRSRLAIRAALKDQQ